MLAMLAAFRPGQETFSAPIRTGWIFLHIVLLLAAYAALFVSLLASLLYLIQERRLKRKSTGHAGSRRWTRRSRPSTRSPSRPSSSAFPA